MFLTEMANLGFVDDDGAGALSALYVAIPIASSCVALVRRRALSKGLMGHCLEYRRSYSVSGAFGPRLELLARVAMES